MLTETKDRYVVMDVRGDGVPVDRQAFTELTDALDLMWELRRAHFTQRVSFFVIDADDPERGWIEEED